MRRPRALLAAVACAACCAGPVAVIIAGGSTAALAWVLWPTVAVVIALATIVTAGWIRQRRSA